jgi:Protein of unknown function (DUF732)
VLNHQRGLVLAAAALLLSGPVVAPIPAHAQGADDFLKDLNSVGIGNPSDSHNFDLVGFGNALCWRIYSGDPPAQVIEEIVTKSGSNTQLALTHQQAQAALSFAVSDLCPDPAPTQIAQPPR